MSAVQVRPWALSLKKPCGFAGLFYFLPQDESALDPQLKLIEDVLFMGAQSGSRVQSRIQLASIEKKDHSPVTVADLAIQAAVVLYLRDADPNFAIIAEEDLAQVSGPEGESTLAEVTHLVRSVRPNANEADVLDALSDRLDSTDRPERYWILDPIDGTKGFLRRDQYAVALGLYENGEIVAGGLGCPNLSLASGETGAICTARRGEGAWYRTQQEGPRHRLRVSMTVEPGSLVLCESVEAGHSSHGWSAEIMAKLNLERPPLRLDSQCKYAAVAAGRADFYLRLPTRPGYVEKVWDHAGGVVVVEEAGGVITDIHGRPLSFRHGQHLEENEGLVVSNGPCHDAILKAVQSTR